MPQYLIVAIEYSMYEKYIEYFKKNPFKKYITYCNNVIHNNGDILLLYSRHVSKKIRAGICGYAILNNESKTKPNTLDKIVDDKLEIGFYSEISKIVFINNFISLENIFKNAKITISVKSFSTIYIKKILYVQLIPENCGKAIYQEINKKDNIKILVMSIANSNSSSSSKNLKDDSCIDSFRKKLNDADGKDSDYIVGHAGVSSDESTDDSHSTTSISSSVKSSDSSISQSHTDSSGMATSDNSSEDTTDRESTEDTTDRESTEDTTDRESTEDTTDRELTEDSDNNYNTEDNIDDDPDHINGLIPIMVDLCKEFKLPLVKYDKSKYNKFKNPDSEEKCNYFKEHVVKCRKCRTTNNNRLELSYLLNNAVILYNEYADTQTELEEILDKYHNCQRYDCFGYELNKIHIKLNYISDSDSMYYKCILVLASLDSSI